MFKKHTNLRIVRGNSASRFYGRSTGYKGKEGDRINAILSAAGFNFSKLI
ncbi:hypothetical protein [Leptospira noguchii]|uniref:Uncharacterized protein n=1 Tax=Leptospira noguchii str. 2007001578 TaxID=1049974 RepID=A0ABN0J4Z3_9LEPT|nr:hypothetical protein [Leptospira noguchii]EMN02075.1 hypothetical protein LEP1GSC035_3169 [Leptospira noguchii str. 2007001578]